MTLNELIEYIEENYGVDLIMLSAGVTIVFSTMLPLKKSQERKAMTLKTLVETLCKKVSYFIRKLT